MTLTASLVAQMVERPFELQNALRYKYVIIVEWGWGGDFKNRFYIHKYSIY